jgi:hypothetical protein
MVAFLDILGYSNFLQNNEPEQAATIVRDCLLNAPTNIKNVVEKIDTKNSAREPIKKAVDRFKWLIFSDTILVTNSYAPKDSDKTKAFSWIIFLAVLGILYRKLFNDGLPIRGGVCYGNYFVEENCFAGRSIIAAYRLSNSLNLAGITLDHSSMEELNIIKARSYYPKLADSLLVNYLVPMKN